MKIQIWSLGKSHESYVKQGIELFSKRLNNYFSAEWKIISPPKNAAALSENELKKAEAQLVLNLMSKDDFLVLLDERGALITSNELAQQIQIKADQAIKNMVFLIGGAYGVDEMIRQKAQLTLSLSKMVFPHQIVRLVLVEQLYRACTILRNEKYHHQ